MRPTEIFRYYAFGYDTGTLRRIVPGMSIHAENAGLVARLDTFFEFLSELRLNVTQAASTYIRKLLEEIKELPKDATVTPDLAQRVQAALGRIDVTLDAELQLSQAYILRPKRYNNEQLLESPGSLLGDGVFAELSEIGRYDFAEACVCVAFERPTAVAFHLMRCVEGCLRDYYCSIVKRNRVRNLLWYDMITHLSKRREKPPKTLLDHLNNIRHNFRNPTQHPQSRYTLDEAQNLLGVAIDAINRLAAETNN